MNTSNGGAHTASTADYRRARDQLWSAVIDRDEYAAVADIFAMLDAGLTPEDVLLEVIAPVQNRVGLAWAANQITVAQEHAATAISDHLITVIRHRRAGKPATKAGRIVVACVGGELHALPARLVAEVLHLRGWQIDYLGADVPTPYLTEHLEHNAPEAMALSCSISTRLPVAHAAIRASRAVGVTVLAGGPAFGSDGRFAYQLGADGWAADARGAAELLRSGLRPVRAWSTRKPVDELPHLSDKEYGFVSRSAAQLVRGTMAQLVDRFPPMRTYNDVKRRHATEEVAQIVDHLAAALYVDDDDLFAEFIASTARILDARGVASASLYPAVELLSEQLKDFPRSQRLLQTAYSALNALGARA